MLGQTKHTVGAWTTVAMMRIRILRALAVLPAAGVFAWIIGVIPASGTPPPVPQPQVTTVARDAWHVPIVARGEPDVTMVAWSELPARVMPKSEAAYQQEIEQRAAMPATKSGIAFVPSSYDDHLKATARKNRLRITRLWYARAIDPQIPPALLAFMSAPAVACAEHTWAYARELDVTFDLSPKGSVTNLATDGPPALTECLAQRLTEWKAPAKRKAQPTSVGGKVILSFVVVKV